MFKITTVVIPTRFHSSTCPKTSEYFETGHPDAIKKIYETFNCNNCEWSNSNSLKDIFDKGKEICSGAKITQKSLLIEVEKMCPFCGSPPGVNLVTNRFPLPAGIDGFRYTIFCTKHSCIASNLDHSVYTSYEDALDAWCKRI